MDDFFKQFRENLDARPEPAFEEKDWRKLSNRLDRQAGKRPLPLVWWWAALPLTLLLLGANVLFFSALKDARQKIAALEMHRDTVYLTKVVYRTDTVYQTRIVRQTVVEYRTIGSGWAAIRPVTPPAPPQGGYASAGDLRGIQEVESQSIAQLKEKDSSVLSLNEPLTEIISSPTPIPNLTIPPLRGGRGGETGAKWGEPPQPHDFPLPEKHAEWDEKLLKTLYAMRPKGFQAGAHAGWALPLLAELKQPGGTSLGLHVAIGFSPQLQMWADGDYFKLLYEADHLSEDLGIPAPTNPPPSDEYQLQSAEVAQQSFQFSAGMQYFFNPKGAWQPFIGAGFGAVRTLPYDVFYDYEHPTFLPYTTVEEDVNGKETLSGFLLLRAGIERRITQKWNWRLVASWRNSWQENQFPVSRLLGLQSGLTFRF